MVPSSSEYCLPTTPSIHPTDLPDTGTAVDVRGSMGGSRASEARRGSGLVPAVVALYSLIALMFTAILAPAARALPVTYVVSGTLGTDASDLPPGWPFAAGQAFTASITYDPALAGVDTVPDPTIGAYPNAITGFSITISAASYSTGFSQGSGFGLLVVFDDSSGDLLQGPGVFIAESGIPGATWVFPAISALDSTGTAFSSDAIPTSLDPTDFDSGSLLLDFYSGVTPTNLLGSVVGTGSVVPEPSIALLLALGIAGLAARRGFRPTTCRCTAASSHSAAGWAGRSGGRAGSSGATRRGR